MQPYDSSSAKRFYNEIEERLEKQKPASYNGVTLSMEAHDFLSRALKVDTDKRIGWRDMLNHPLIKVKEQEPLPQRFVQRASLIIPKFNPELES
jgi:serine/threonine protein kinase